MLKRVCVFVGVVGTGVSGGCAARHTESLAECGDIGIRIPLRIESNRPYVDVYVNGEGPFNFLIDIGASGEGRFDAAPVARLGIEVVSTAENSDGVNTATVDVVVLNHVRVGQFARTDVEVLTRDYNPSSRNPALARLDGILGLEFFPGYVATIDWPREHLLLIRGELRADAEHVVAYEEYPEIPIQIGGAEFMCSVDTGSSVTMHLPLEHAEALVAGELRDAGTASRANTTFTMRRGRIGADVVIAGNRIEGVDALFSDRARWINVGSGVLSRFAVSFDAANRLLRIAPEAPGADDLAEHDDSP